jgi:hypothetical protein
MGDDDTLTHQVDLHRNLVVMPMYEAGRRVLPSLFESPITEFIDEDGYPVDDIEDAEYAVCKVHADTLDRRYLSVQIDYEGPTIH